MYNNIQKIIMHNSLDHMDKLDRKTIALSGAGLNKLMQRSLFIRALSLSDFFKLNNVVDQSVICQWSYAIEMELDIPKVFFTI